MLFPTTVVGSMPRPQYVRDLLRPESRRELGETEHRKRMDAAVASVVALQEMAGIDIISDGEWRRLSYIGIIADICSGFDVTFRGDQPWTTVVEPIEAAQPGIIAQEALFVRERTERDVKVALPSPYLLGQRMWDPDASSKAYRTREDFMRALVPILRDELDILRNSGARYVQFDDPHLCLFVDPRVRRQYDNPEREMDLCVDLLNEILSGFDDLETAIHLCRRNKARQGWVGEGGYGPILSHLAKLNVNAYMLEFAIPVAGDYDIIKALPQDKRIGLGCVDCRSERIDSPQEIMDRVQRALEYVEPERVFLHPDCGFAPGSAADIPLDEAYLKLKNEAEAARRLRQEIEPA